MPAHDAEVVVLLVRKAPGARLGVRLHSEDVASHLTDPEWRAPGSVVPVVKSVEPGSEAERAGITEGDEIVSINGETRLTNVQAAAQLREAVGVLTLAVARMPLAAETGENLADGGEFEDVEIKIHKPWSDMAMGVEMTKLTDGEIFAVIVSGVRIGGAGHSAGLQVEDQIMSVKTETVEIANVTSAMEVAKAMRAAVNDILITVRRYHEPPVPPSPKTAPEAPAAPAPRPSLVGASGAEPSQSMWGQSMSGASGQVGGYLARYGDGATGVQETSWFARISRASSRGRLSISEVEAAPKEFTWKRRSGCSTRISSVAQSAQEASVRAATTTIAEESPATDAGKKKTFVEIAAPVVSATQTIGQLFAASGRATGQSLAQAGRATGQGIGAFFRELDGVFGADEEDDYYDRYRMNHSTRRDQYRNNYS